MNQGNSVVSLKSIKEAGLLEDLLRFEFKKPVLDMALIESIFETGVDFNRSNYGTILNAMTAKDNIELFKLGMKYHQIGGFKVKSSDICTLNVFHSLAAKEMLDVLVGLTGATELKKCFKKVAMDWMCPSSAWALLKLDKSIPKKNWNFFQDITDTIVVPGLLYRASQCRNIEPSWFETFLNKKSYENIYYESAVNNAGRYSQRSVLTMLLKDRDYDSAARLLKSGYKINNNHQNFESEVVIAIDAGVNAAGVEWLLKNGASPFVQLGYDGKHRVICNEKDIGIELKQEKEYGHRSTHTNWDKAIVLALANKDDQMVDILIENGLSLSRALFRCNNTERAMLESALLKRQTKNIGKAANDVKSAL